MADAGEFKIDSFDSFFKNTKKFLVGATGENKDEDYGEEKVDDKCLTIKETQIPLDTNDSEENFYNGTAEDAF